MLRAAPEAGPAPQDPAGRQSLPDPPLSDRKKGVGGLVVPEARVFDTTRVWAAARSRSDLLLALCALASVPDCAAAADALAPYQVVGDAIAAPLAGKSGDASRGRRIVLDRADGNCLICHKVPEPGEPFQGELGPDLAGAGSRLTPGQLRLRLVDQSRLNAATIMPPYYRVSGLVRVAEKWRDRPVLDAQAIEDVVVYLGSLK